MVQVSVTINGRQFRMACEDGEEPHLLQLAEDLDQRISQLRARFGEIGDTRLTVMAALTLADELSETKEKLQRFEPELASLQDARVAIGRARQGDPGGGRRRAQFGGRAHRGHHPAGSTRRCATTKWRWAETQCSGKLRPARHTTLSARGCGVRRSHTPGALRS